MSKKATKQSRKTARRKRAQAEAWAAAEAELRAKQSWRRPQPTMLTGPALSLAAAAALFGPMQRK